VNDEAFLSAIEADPADNTRRLVYADWLEGQGNPRADFIRLRLQVRGHGGRKRALARLAELSGTVEGEWRRRAFAVPKMAV
jgi:uncharacterized protein (TIGR02996 family)